MGSTKSRVGNAGLLESRRTSESADAGPSPRCTLYAYGASTPLRVPKARQEPTAGPAGSEGSI